MDYVFGFILVLSTLQFTPSTGSQALLLTPLIKQNQTAEARNKSLVNPSLFLNLTSHSGFLTIDEEYNSNTFFWYFPVADRPVNETPWIIWLQGGPGYSSLVGLFDEIGPFGYTKDNGLKKRQWSWSQNHSLLFLDNPVGSGFSFTNSEFGFATNFSTYSNHLYIAVQQFLTIFPELRSAPLYIAGESYAGRFVPGLATRIMENDKRDPAINLQGIMLGNPVLNREDVVNLTAVYYNWGLIDTQGALAARPLQEEYGLAVEKGENQVAVQAGVKLLTLLNQLAEQHQRYNILVDGYDIDGFEVYLRRPEVMEALHVGGLKFSSGNATVGDKLLPDFVVEIQSKIEKLLERYRVLIYCGQMDLTAPCVPNAEARRQKWHWSGKHAFLKAPRVPFSFNDTVDGYVKSGGNFTEVLVRNAGHLVPIDKPAVAYNIISSFIKHMHFPPYPSFSAIHEFTPMLPEEVPPIVEISTGTLKKEEKETEDNHKVIPHQPPTVKSTATQDEPKMDTGTKAGIIISVFVNVLLLVVLIVGILAYCKLKKKTEDFFYSTVDNVSDDIFLT